MDRGVDRSGERIGERIDVVELSIAEMLDAMESGAVTSVELVSAYLNRIAYYDRTGLCLHAIAVLDPTCLEQAAASDARRRAGNAGPLEGVPFTVKDSYKVKGLTVASGSPALADLVATEDAASVAQLRAAGAVLLGKTNMPPMAAGGMQPGLYDYARSPYHPQFLTAAWGSGSSNGSGTATAASMCAFAMAEETVSSGRAPASNNSLVAYTPSRGVLSIRGNWPLRPTCDVVVPHTRTVSDLLLLLDVLAVSDEDSRGDFWRQQSAVELPTPESVLPGPVARARPERLDGLRIGVPRLYIGEDPVPLDPPVIRPPCERCGIARQTICVHSAPRSSRSTSRWCRTMRRTAPIRAGSPHADWCRPTGGQSRADRSPRWPSMRSCATTQTPS